MMHKGVYILLKKSLLSEWKGGFLKMVYFPIILRKMQILGILSQKLWEKKLTWRGGGRKSNIIIIPNLILYF